MNRDGARKIEDTLKTAHIPGVMVEPMPEPGQDFRFVTVSWDMPKHIAPAFVLLALWRANLMHREGPQDTGLSQSLEPSLRDMGVTPGNITFEDMNGGYA